MITISRETHQRLKTLKYDDWELWGRGQRWLPPGSRIRIDCSRGVRRLWAMKLCFFCCHDPLLLLIWGCLAFPVTKSIPLTCFKDGLWVEYRFILSGLWKFFWNSDCRTAPQRKRLYSVSGGAGIWCRQPLYVLFWSKITLKIRVFWFQRVGAWVFKEEHHRTPLRQRLWKVSKHYWVSTWRFVLINCLHEHLL